MDLLVINLNKIKEKGMFLILLILLIVGIYFNNNKGIQTFINLNIDEIELKEYKGLNNKFHYKLPADWITNTQEFSGDEIMYHNDFKTPDGKIHGFVQLWNLNKPIIDFLKDGIKSATGIVSFKNYFIEPIKINGNEGYILYYSRLGNDNKYIKAFEIFILNKDNIFYRFSFFMDEKDWKKEYRMFFLELASYAELI